jgi:hypothetical protein
MFLSPGHVAGLGGAHVDGAHVGGVWAGSDATNNLRAGLLRYPAVAATNNLRAGLLPMHGFSTAWLGPALALGPWNWVTPLLLICSFVPQFLPPHASCSVFFLRKNDPDVFCLFVCVLPYLGERTSDGRALARRATGRSGWNPGPRLREKWAVYTQSKSAAADRISKLDYVATIS